MTPGVIYCRISRDAEGLALGVERQRQDCVELAAQHGINVPVERILIENDTGASVHSRKARPVYEQLKAMVAAGEVGTVIFYSNSRLTRRPRELDDWIELHRKTGVRLISKVSGKDDLGTADGRMVARIKSDVDAAEAERISERVKRTFEQRRAAGQASTGGPRTFGYSSSGLDAVVVPEEADAIRAGATLLLAGGTYGEVARDWARRGLKPVSAKAWTRESVRSTYRSPRIAGLVAHEGAIIGEARTPGILSRATWEAVQSASQHAPSRPAAQRRHVLSGSVFCALCGATMVTQGESYRCVVERQGCGGVKRNKAWLDALVDGYVREKLAQFGDVDTPAPVGDGRREVIANLEAKIAALREQFESGALEAQDYFPSLSTLRGRVNDLRKQEADMARRTAVASTQPLEAWENGVLSVRRGILQGLIAGIYVKPVGRIGRASIPVSSVEIVPA